MSKYILRKEYFGGLLYSIYEGKTVGFLNKEKYNRAVDHYSKNETERLSEVVGLSIFDRTEIRIIENPNIYQNELSAPIIAYLHITEKCNLICNHCMFHQKGNGSSDLTKDEIIRIIDQLLEFGCYSLRITGGEPFVRSDIFEIIDYAKTKGMYIEVNTNGIFGKEVLNKILESNIDRMIFSVDGVQETHDKIRGQGNYQKTIANIRKLKKTKGGRMELRINATLTKTLWKLFDDFINDLKILDVEININILRPYGRADNIKEEMLSPQEFMSYAKTIAANEKYKKMKLRNTNFDLYGYHEHSYKGNDPIPFDRSTCAAASYGMGILPNGEGNLCGYLASEPELKAPNIKDVGVLGIWFSEPFRKMRTIKKEKCSKCGFYKKECIGFCHVMSYWKTKKFGKADYYCFKELMGKNEVS